MVSKRSKRVFQGSFKDILRKFPRCLKKESCVFQENIKKASSVFQRVFNEVLFCNFDLIAATRAEGGLVKVKNKHTSDIMRFLS